MCLVIKFWFYKLKPGTLVKAIQPFERVDLGFKGLLTGKTRNKLTNTLDSYLLFPVMIFQLKLSYSLFSIFHATSIHPHFMPEQLKKFLIERNMAVSQTLPYNPQGNSLSKHYNVTIWKTIQFVATSHKHPITYW